MNKELNRPLTQRNKNIVNKDMENYTIVLKVENVN